jgi:hypothetical protein
MPQIHNYTHSSGYCFGPNNQNGVFGPSNNNPKVLRDHLNIALSSKHPGWFANAYQQECETVEEKVCDISSLPVIQTIGPTGYTPCVVNIFNAIDLFAPPVISSDPILDIFLGFLTFVATANPQYGAVCMTDSFELRIIFDDKISVSWGALIDNTMGFYVKTSAPLPFPPSFQSFEIVAYSTLTMTNYSILRYT